jgi:UDP-glucuronate decarboxylase
MNMEGAVDRPVNLGNPAEITISELAELVISLVGSRSPVELLPLPEDDPRQRCPDITRARQLLNWLPKVPLQEGLTRTIAYFDNLLSVASQAEKRVWKIAV